MAAARQMRLRVATPTGTVIDEDIVALRAEDDSGFFGLQPGHEAFFTSLVIGVVSYRTPSGSERFLAVRRGVLWMTGDEVAIVTRDAVTGEDVTDLEGRVVSAFRRTDEEERKGGAALTRMQIAALRQLMQYEDAGRRASP